MSDTSITCACGNQWSPDALPRCPKCGQVAPEPTSVKTVGFTTTEPSTPTPTIPGYDILDELGRGGMGVVYKARHLALNRLVAIKMILNRHHAGGEELTRFLSEAEAVASLQHPNIVQIHEVGEHDGLPFMALELVSGGTLSDRVTSIKPTPTESAEVALDLARAMNVAHQAGIVHRDLKPSNVLLTEEGTPKITDFGLVKRIDDSGASLPSELTQTGVIVGTPSYMAPEQATGHSKRVGPSADIYALGGILYHTLTGRAPFDADSQLDTLLMVAHQDPTRPREIDPDIPTDLETICLKCLHKEPTKRYSSSAELADDLDRWLSGRPIHARPVGAAERFLLWIRRRPTVAGLLLLVVAVTLVGLGLAGWQWRQAVAARNLAEHESQRATRALELEQRRAVSEKKARREAERHQRDAQRQLSRAEASLHSSRLALVQVAARDRNHTKALDILSRVPFEQRRWEWRLLQRQNAFPLQLDAPTLPHDESISSACWSPDGRFIATAAGDSVHLWNATTLQRLGTVENHSDTVYSVAFSADSKLLASASRDKTVKLLDLDQVKITHTLEGHTGSITSLAFHRTAPLLATGSTDKSVRVWNTQTGKQQLLLEEPTAPVLDVALSQDGHWLAAAESSGSFYLWKMPEGKRVQVPPKQETRLSRATCLEFHPDSTKLYCGLQSGHIDIWTLPNLRLAKNIAAAKDRVSSIAFSPDGQFSAASSGDSLEVFGAADTPVYSLVGSSPFLAFSPDGTRLASNSGSKAVKLWDVRLQQERFALPFSTNTLRRGVFATEGDRLAYSARDNSIALWSLTEHRLEHILPPSENPPLYMVFARDGLLASSSGDTIVSLWDASRGTLLRTIRTPRPVTALTVDPDGCWIASGNELGEVTVWDRYTGKRLEQFRPHSGRVTALTSHPKGTLLASGSADSTVSVWSIADGKKRFDARGHGGQISTLCWNADGSILASASLDRTVRFWDTKDGSLLRAIRDNDGVIGNVGFSPDGTRLHITPNQFGFDASGVKVCDVVSGETIFSLPKQTVSFAGNSSFDPKGRFLFSPWTSHATLWDSGDLAATPYRLPFHAFNGILSHPESDTLIGGSDSNSVSLWSIGRESEPAVLEGGSSPLCLSDDGRWLVCGLSGPGWSVIDLTTRKHHRPRIEKPGVPRSTSFHPTKPQIAFPDRAGRIHLWNPSSRRFVRVLESGTSTRITSTVFHPRRHQLVSGDASGTILVWNLENGTSEKFAKVQGQVVRVAYHPEGGHLLTISRGSGLQLWETKTRKAVYTLDTFAHARAHCAAFSPSGKRIVVLAPDLHATILDSETGQRLSTFRETAGVVGVAFLSETWLILQSNDGRVFQQRLPPLAKEENHDRSNRQIDIHWHRQNYQQAFDTQAYRAALFHIERLLALRPDDPRYLAMRLETLTHLGSAGRVLETAKRLIETWPTVPIAYRQPPWSDWQPTEKFSRSLLDELAKSEPSWSSWVLTSLLRSRLGDEGAARAALDKAVRLQPRRAWLWARTAQWALELEEPEQLREALEKLRELASEELFDWHQEQASAHESIGDFRSAAWHLDKAVRIRSDEAELLRRLGSAQERTRGNVGSK